MPASINQQCWCRNNKNANIYSYIVLFLYSFIYYTYTQEMYCYIRKVFISSLLKEGFKNKKVKTWWKFPSKGGEGHDRSIMELLYFCMGSKWCKNAFFHLGGRVHHTGPWNVIPWFNFLSAGFPTLVWQCQTYVVREVQSCFSDMFNIHLNNFLMLDEQITKIYSKSHKPVSSSRNPQ